MLKLTPSVKNYLWGGRKLHGLYGRENNGDLISESWEVSVHPDGVSGCGTGTLATFIAKHPLSVDRQGSGFPVLIKYIDAAQNLSVQVHPDDAYALAHEGDYGKTEMWYIIDADCGAGIYCGFRRDTSPEEFLQKVNDGTVEELLNFIPVKKGDCFLIETGTVHAIGAGCVICEIQQNSNVTYRVYDYNRRSGNGQLRQLHVQKAIEVVNFRKFEDRTNSGPILSFTGGTIQTLTQNRYFHARKLNLNGVFAEMNQESFTAVNILKGYGKINGELFRAGDSFFVPCEEKIEMTGKAEIILTTKSNLKYFFGVDLGGSFIKCGIVDSTGRMIIKDKVPTAGDYDAVTTAVADLARCLPAKVGIAISGIGIGVPGTIDSEHGIVVYSNNLGWEKKKLAEDVQRRTGLPVSVTNDANAAALGEYAYGAGKTYKSMVLVTLGTGVGSGIVMNGKLLEGFRGAGSELGHMTIKDRGLLCTCGRRGCLEMYASTTALLRRAREHMAKNKDTALWRNCGGEAEALNGEMLFKAVKEKGTGAYKIYQQYLTDLSCGLVNIGNAIRPEAIVLGGGISAVGRLLTAPLQRKLNREIFGGTQYAPIKIVTAELFNDAGIYGAAKLAMGDN